MFIVFFALVLLDILVISLPGSVAGKQGGGSGFAGSRMFGSQHNDPFVQKDGRLGTTSNNSGGVQGGISNGEPVVFRVAFKPPATIGLAQETAAFDGASSVLEAKGRHDPCVVPRAIPIVETMTALVLLDLVLRQSYRTI